MLLKYTSSAFQEKSILFFSIAILIAAAKGDQVYSANKVTDFALLKSLIGQQNSSHNRSASYTDIVAQRLTLKMALCASASRKRWITNLYQCDPIDANATCAYLDCSSGHQFVTRDPVALEKKDAGKNKEKEKELHFEKERDIISIDFQFRRCKHSETISASIHEGNATTAAASIFPFYQQRRGNRTRNWKLQRFYFRQSKFPEFSVQARTHTHARTYRAKKVSKLYRATLETREKETEKWHRTVIADIVGRA